MKSERLQKILARAGVASRRHAEEMITSGRVRVNGHVVSELGAKADPANDRIEVDGQRLVAENLVYYIFHKPRGVVSTMSDPEGRPSVKESLARFPNIKARVFPVGRLDFATSGALLITNDGEFMNGLLHPRTDVPKTYIVKVSGKMMDAHLESWRTGVSLSDGMTKAADVKFDRFEDDKTWFYVTLTEGRNQQIRRMGEATGYPVMRLSRISFAGITTEGLAPGSLRAITREELQDLRKRYGVPRKLPVGSEDLKQLGNARVNTGRSPRTARPKSGARGKPAITQQHGDRTQGARYGGGSPGRRSHEVTEDWGGGAARGRSTRGDAPPDTRTLGRGKSGGQTSGASRGASGGQASGPSARGDLGGGRYGRTRTTGTAGGIGASEDSSRVKGRGRSR